MIVAMVTTTTSEFLNSKCRRCVCYVFGCWWFKRSIPIQYVQLPINSNWSIDLISRIASFYVCFTFHFSIIIIIFALFAVWIRYESSCLNVGHLHEQVEYYWSFRGFATPTNAKNEPFFSTTNSLHFTTSNWLTFWGCAQVLAFVLHWMHTGWDWQNERTKSLGTSRFGKGTNNKRNEYLKIELQQSFFKIYALQIA